VVLYSAAFRPGSGAEWVVSAQPCFAPTVDNYFKQGLYAAGIAVVESATGPLYTAVFRPGPNGAEWVLGNYLWKDFAKQTDTYFARDSTQPASPPADWRSSATSEPHPNPPPRAGEGAPFSRCAYSGFIVWPPLMKRRAARRLSPACRVACLVDAKYIKKPIGRGLCHVL
jgi:hypothetical protein